jgi:hypothetical protein
MSRNIYKYFSEDVLEIVFDREGYCGLKCSFPSEYNDPYELFLGADLTLGPELLATYRDIVQELPQHPTTCFSRSPVVAPMWAHYARNHSGFVLEFEADKLRESIDEVEIADVHYKDEPNPNIAEFVERAAVTKKPRHAVWLLQSVLGEAYFSKYSAWSYEQECRLVANEADVVDVAGSMVLYVPVGCIKSVILGSKSHPDSIDKSKGLAETFNFGWFSSKIGKSIPFPFFIDDQMAVHRFDGQGIVAAERTCVACSEPVAKDQETCAWCGITEQHKLEAARSNPFRILDRIGHLESYFEGVREIERSRKK